ncbi:MAG: phosphatase PAP2 family protein [Nitrospiraceae bacterium]
MTSSGQGLEARGDRQDHWIHRSLLNTGSLPPLASSLLPLALSCIVLIIALWGLFELDRPLARFVQSIDFPWFEMIGQAGKQMGSWTSLLGISLIVLAIGQIARQEEIRKAGWQSLIAHGAAALAVQTLKHVIARPRPRLAETQTFQFGPTFASGLDSFPSGHTTASFAIAAVLAKHFPAIAFPAFSVAGLIAASRVITGSHFPSDIVGGAVLGTMVGSLVTHPLDTWRTSLMASLVNVAPYVAGAFGIVWIACHQRPEAWIDWSMLVLGVIMIIGGAWVRIVSEGGSGNTRPISPSIAHSRIVVGIALTTGSLLVTSLAILVALSQWMACRVDYAETGATQSADRRASIGAREAVSAVAFAMVVLLIQSVKGVIQLP